MVAPTLNPEEWQYLDSGIVLNSSVALPFVDLTSVDGVDNAPIRMSTTDREGVHGAWVDSEFESMRTITLEGNIYASVATLDTYLNSLKVNMAPVATAQPLYLGLDSSLGTKMFLAKSQGLRYAKSTSRSFGMVEFQAQFLCEDPRLYDTTVTSQNIPGTLTLPGNRDSVGTITIAGARTNPTITLGSSTLTFAYTLTAGNTIVVDLDKRTVILNGTTNVRSSMTITGGWPKLQAGSNVFTVGGTGSGTITVAARGAWR